MADKTGIQWSDATWNPVRGCTLVSPGCTNCYAQRQAHRMNHPGGAYEGLTVLTGNGPRWNGKAITVPKMLDQPLRWTRPRRIFVNSMSDLFHPDVPPEFIAAVFGVMAMCPQHVFQVLTKRPERALQWFRQMRDGYGDVGPALQVAMGAQTNAMFPDEDPPIRWRRAVEDVLDVDGLERWPLPNVWLGVSAEDQQRADERIPVLLKCPAAVRFVSAEPLLGPIDFGNTLGSETLPFLTEDNVDTATGGGFLIDTTKIEDTVTFPGLDWVIVGGESGHGARPYNVEWPRDIIEQCREAGVPVFMKQMGSVWANRPRAKATPKRHPKGGEPSQWAEDLRVRQYPAEVSL